MNICYNKTRHRIDHNGQTGYTMHILDGMVTEVLHQIFDRMKAVSEEESVSQIQMNATTGSRISLPPQSGILPKPPRNTRL